VFLEICGQIAIQYASLHSSFVGGKADPFLVIRKAHGMVKGAGGSLVKFVDPVPNKYMGLQNPESLLYDGAKEHCKKTLNPIFPGVCFRDITE
jgi:hypothetical protein